MGKSFLKIFYSVYRGLSIENKLRKKCYKTLSKIFLTIFSSSIKDPPFLIFKIRYWIHNQHSQKHLRYRKFYDSSIFKFSPDSQSATNDKKKKIILKNEFLIHFEWMWCD